MGETIDEAVLRQALDELYETEFGLKGLVTEAMSQGEYCCQLGCGSGACESCPCCAAGWCVSGGGDLPRDPQDLEQWLSVAADYNPVAAALRDALKGGDDGRE